MKLIRLSDIVQLWLRNEQKNFYIREEEYDCKFDFLRCSGCSELMAFVLLASIQLLIGDYNKEAEINAYDPEFFFKLNGHLSKHTCSEDLSQDLSL